MQGMARVLCYVYSYNHEAVETVKHLCISEIVIWLTIASSFWYSAIRWWAYVLLWEIYLLEDVWVRMESRLFPYTLWFSLRLQFLAIVRASLRLGHMSQECRTPSKLGLYQQLSAKRAGMCSGFFVSSSWKPFALQQLPQQLEPVYLYSRNWEWCAAIHRDFLVNTAYLGGVLEYWKLR